MDPSNPFSALTLIAAPAVLTNASSVLALGTSNRLGRAVDRARELTVALEQEAERDSGVAQAMLRELAVAQRRMPLLIRALQAFYAAVGSFAAAALISLIGAVITPSLSTVFGRGLEAVAVTAGAVAVGALGRGTLLLVRETRMAVVALEERMAQAQLKFAGWAEDAEPLGIKEA